MRRILVACVLTLGVLMGLSGVVAAQGPFSAQIQRALRAFLGQANTWTGTQTFTDITISGVCTGCGTPGGANTQVQFNDSGAFGGDAGLVYNKTTDVLTTTGQINLNYATAAIRGTVDSLALRTGFANTGVFSNHPETGFQVGDTGTVWNVTYLEEDWRPGSSDNARDLGRATNRVRSGYFGTSVLLGTNAALRAGTPTVGGACGTGPTIAGSNTAGKVTTGTGAPTSCTITFSSAWTTAPSCNVTNETTANLARATSTTTSVVLAGTMIAGDVLAYQCIGY